MSLRNGRVTVPPDVLLSELGGESVLLNLATERYFGLDGTGTRIWQVLTTSGTVQAAYRTLLEEYDVGAETLERDLTELLDQLVEAGLLTVSDG